MWEPPLWPSRHAKDIPQYKIRTKVMLLSNILIYFCMPRRRGGAECGGAKPWILLASASSAKLVCHSSLKGVGDNVVVTGSFQEDCAYQSSRCPVSSDIGCVSCSLKSTFLWQFQQQVENAFLIKKIADLKRSELTSTLSLNKNDNGEDNGKSLYWICKRKK